MSTLKITEAETSTALSGGASKVVVSEQVLVIAPQTGPPLDSSVPLMDGTAAAGSSTSSAHGDHRHPTDTSRAATAHAHAESDVTNLVTDLSAKADLSTVAAALALKAPLASPSFTGKVGLPSLPDAPGSPSAGDMYFDSALGQLRYYDGSGWDTVVCAEDAQTIPGVKTFTGNPVFNDGAIPTAKVNGLDASLAAISASAAPATSLWLPTTTGNTVSCPTAAALSVTGGDIIVKIAPDAWGVAMALAYKGWPSTGWYFGIGADNKPFLNDYDGTGYRSHTSASALPAGVTVAGRTTWLKARRVNDTGASTYTTEFSYSDDGVTWTSLNTQTTAGTGALGASAGALVLWFNSNDASGVRGKVYRFTLKDLAGTTVADWRADIPGARYRDAYANIWTVNGTANAWMVA